MNTLRYKRNALILSFDKVLYVIMFLALFAEMSLILFQGPNPTIPLPLAWNYFGVWKWFSVSDIPGFSVESSNSVWVVNRGLSDKATVEHVKEAQIQTWSLPSGSGSSVDFFRERVLADSRQEPVLAALYSVYFLKDSQYIVK